MKAIIKNDITGLSFEMEATTILVVGDILQGFEYETNNQFAMNCGHVDKLYKLNSGDYITFDYGEEER